MCVHVEKGRLSPHVVRCQPTEKIQVFGNAQVPQALLLLLLFLLLLFSRRKKRGLCTNLARHGIDETTSGRMLAHATLGARGVAGDGLP
jgi:hypothetical protein